MSYVTTTNNLIIPARYAKTYSVRSPLNTHYRRATCAEYGCSHYENGWSLHKEILSPELLHLATHSGRRYREMNVSEGETYLVFEPGQECFASVEHRVRTDRTELFLVGRGNFKTFNPRKAQKMTPVDFVDSMGNHMEMLKTRRERG